MPGSEDCAATQRPAEPPPAQARKRHAAVNAFHSLAAGITRHVSNRAACRVGRSVKGGPTEPAPRDVGS